MKKLLCCFCFLFVLTLHADDATNVDHMVWHYAEPLSAPPLVGRFILYSASVPVVTSAGPVECPFVFKLDTATGRTWYFTFISQPGQTNVGWMPLSDLTLTSPQTSPTTSPPASKP
jgi:hypothetical protein